MVCGGDIVIPLVPSSAALHALVSGGICSILGLVARPFCCTFLATPGFASHMCESRFLSVGRPKQVKAHRDVNRRTS